MWQLRIPGTGGEIDLTDRQSQALDLLSTRDRVLLYGGSRSGKTVVILIRLLLLMLEHPGVRMFAGRWRAVHAKMSLWEQTLLPLLRERLRLPANTYHVNYGEMVLTLGNGSSLWVGGFDDKERVEKLLGQEYLCGFLNEISQISYDAYLTMMTRLAQRVEGLRNAAYCDCNPPSPQHWAHRVFIEGVEPRSRQPFKEPGRYGAMLMNPIDHMAHLPTHYLEQLDDLSPAQRRRMKFGEWVQPEGSVFDGFTESDILDASAVPPFDDFTVGVDFGMEGAAVLVGWRGDEVCALDSCGGYGLTASALNAKIVEMCAHNWTLPPAGEDDDGPFWLSGGRAWRGQAGGARLRQPPPMDYVAYCDPSGGERIQEIANGVEANNAVEPGLDWLNMQIERGNFKACRRAAGLFGEIFDYRRDVDTGKIIKEADHFCDALRYGSFSRAARPMPRLRTV